MGISVFLRSPRDRINQVFCISAIALAVWIVFDSISVLYWNQIEVRTILTRFAASAGMVATGLITSFCIIFSKKKALPYKPVVLISLVSFALAILALMPGIVFKEFTVVNSRIIPINGPFRTPLYAAESLLFLVGLAHLVRRHHKETSFGEERLQLKLLAAGILIPATLTIVAFCVLPSFVGDSPPLASVGPLSTVVFILLAGYAMLKHNLFTAEAAPEYMFNNNIVGLCVTRTDGRIIRHNQKLVDILKCGELIGHPLDDLIAFMESIMDKGAFPLRHWFESGQPESVYITLSGLGDKLLEVAVQRLTDKRGRHIGDTYLFRDAAARQQAEEALRQSEETVRALLNASMDSAILIDTEGTILAINQTGAQRLGRTAGELIGVNAYSLFTPALAKERKARVDQAVQTGELIRFEDERDSIVLDSTVCPIFDKNGRVVRLAVYGRDITEQKKTYETLQRSEEHFRALIENALDAIGVVGLDGTILYESPSVERILGYKHEEMVGTNVFDRVHPKNKQAIINGFSKIVENPDLIEHDELPYQHRDGSWRTMEVSARRIPDENSVVVNYRDITDRKRTEEALRESEKRYRTLAEAVTDLIWTLDAKTLRFTYVSPSVQTLLGYSVGEATNKPLDQVLTPASFDFAMRALAEALASGEQEQDNLLRSRPLELEHYRKDGSTIWAEVTTAFLRDHDGRLTEIIGVTRDITKRRLRMEKLRAMSLVDELTGLYNRRGFLTLSQQQLKLAYRTRRSMAVLFMDFDDLKLINDVLGHDQGNLALKETAEILKDTFRESDIVARIGGDEFAILAVEVPRDSTETLTRRLREKIEIHNAQNNSTRKLSISVGVTRYDPAFPCSIDELLSEADKLMYEEKRRKKEPQPSFFST